MQRPAEVAYDIYPLLYDEFQRLGNHAKVQALHLDICRAFSGNYIVPEQQSGFGSQPGFCKVVYLGTYLKPDLTEALTERLFAPAGIEPLVGGLPEGVEVTMRMKEERWRLFVQNYMDQAVTVGGVPAGRDLLDGEKPVRGRLELEGYGCAIVKLEG